MPWRLSHRFERSSREIADRHYSRQKIGTPQFVPPGRCMVLTTDPADALWVSSWQQYVTHSWPGAWVNSLFRREPECPHLASDLIRFAVAATRWYWPETPGCGMVTFVDASKVRRKRDPGRCYLRAGFRPAGKTKGGLLVFQMLPHEMPDPMQPEWRLIA